MRYICPSDETQEIAIMSLNPLIAVAATMTVTATDRDIKATQLKTSSSVSKSRQTKLP